MGRSSKNSSLPPSADSIKDKAEAAKDSTARRAAAKAARKEDLTRKPGKQPAAPRATLKKRDDPTYIVDHELECFSSCGADLATAPVEGKEIRRVFDTSRLCAKKCAKALQRRKGHGIEEIYNNHPTKEGSIPWLQPSIQPEHGRSHHW